MATYKKHCINCKALIPGDSSVCPMCESDEPFSLRCPKCCNPIEANWKVCSNCGFILNVTCPSCGRETLASNLCRLCGARLVVKCPQKKCGEIQVLNLQGRCIKCGSSLK